MWACGLRGAIAYALAINLPDKALSMLKKHRRHHRDPIPVDADAVGVPAIETATLIIVIFTTIVFGLLTGPLLRLLNMKEAGADEDEDQDKGVDLQVYGEDANGDMDYIDDETGAYDAPVMLRRTESKEIWEWWRSFDRDYMKPIFGGSIDQVDAVRDELEMNATVGVGAPAMTTPPPPVAEYFDS